MCGLRQVQYRFFYLVLYYKKGYCNSIEEYCPSQYSKLVQYDVLIGKIFLNISTKTQQYQRSFYWWSIRRKPLPCSKSPKNFIT